MNTSISESMEEARLILESCNDGFLDYRDSELVRHVSKKGSFHLSDESAFYLQNLFVRIKAGSYVPGFNSLFGIPSLFIHRSGDVYWKTSKIGHYSCDDLRDGKVIESTCRLAAACRLIDDDGGRIDSNSVYEKLLDVDYAEKVQTIRHSVFWVVNEDCFRFEVFELKGNNRAEYPFQMFSQRNECAEKWQCSGNSISDFVVVSKEDLWQLYLVTTSDAVMAKRCWSRSKLYPIVVSEVNELISKTINSKKLISKDEIYEAFFGVYLTAAKENADNFLSEKVYESRTRITERA